MNSPFRAPAPPPPEPALAGTKHAPLLAVPEPPPPIPRVWPWWTSALLLAPTAHFSAQVVALVVGHEQAYVPMILGLAVVVPLASWLGFRGLNAGMEAASLRGRSEAVTMLASLLGILAVLVATIVAWSLGFA